MTTTMTTATTGFPRQADAAAIATTVTTETTAQPADRRGHSNHASHATGDGIHCTTKPALEQNCLKPAFVVRLQSCPRKPTPESATE